MNQGMSPRNRADLLLLAAFCGFLFFYGLGALGLVGADEPRYAQVAREMLDRSDWVTPTLLGNLGSKSRCSITGRRCCRSAPSALQIGLRGCPPRSMLLCSLRLFTFFFGASDRAVNLTAR